MAACTGWDVRGEGVVAKRTRRITDYSGRVIRLTDERLRHIREHAEMVRQERKIREVLQSPDVVWTSHEDASVHVYYRRYTRSPVGSKHLLAAVRSSNKTLS